MYIPSTPASRGEVEVDEEAAASVLPEGVSAEEAFEALSTVAAELGYQLVPIEPESEESEPGEPGTGEPGTGEPGKPEGEPAGNASGEVWADYARSVKGATNADLLDEDGKPLGRDALRDKFGTPPES